MKKPQFSPMFTCPECGNAGNRAWIQSHKHELNEAESAWLGMSESEGHNPANVARAEAIARINARQNRRNRFVNISEADVRREMRRAKGGDK